MSSELNETPIPGRTILSDGPYDESDQLLRHLKIIVKPSQRPVVEDAIRGIQLKIARKANSQT